MIPPPPFQHGHSAIGGRRPRGMPQAALNCWLLDDGVIAGSAKDVLKALHVIQAWGPTWGST